MILVTGATGNVGNELVRALVERRSDVRALARDPNRVALPAAVDVMAGDLASPDTVAPALTGIRRAFLLGGFATVELLGRMRETGVEHVVLLTSRCVVAGKPDNAITRMWLGAEAAVRGSGMPWTILRPSGFHSNALRWLPQIQRGDVVRAPWPDVPIASIDPADIAAVAATVLTEPGHQGKTPALSGPQPLTPGEQVTTLARVLRRPLRYEPLSDDEARAEMAADTPAPFIDGFFRFFTDGEFDDSLIVPSVLEITGHAPRTFEQWAQAHTDAFVNDATT
ncbi:MAG TPA: NAD(P)H-binding protein [Acidimicrobiales bacterium]|nr:NAD(P)H-binding protein [Acidimicrobiales bacterium]